MIPNCRQYRVKIPKQWLRKPQNLQQSSQLLRQNAAYTVFLEAAKAEYDANILSLQAQLTGINILQYDVQKKNEMILAILAQLKVKFKSPTYAEFLEAQKKQGVTNSSSLNSTRAPSPELDGSIDLDLVGLREIVEFGGDEEEEDI